jgi:hypothetical protein
MKALRLSLLSAFLGSSAVLAAPVPAELAGGYQALLYTQAGDTGAPLGSVALTLSTKSSVSGKLTLEDKKVYAFKTTLDYSEGVATHASEIIIKRGKGKSDVKLQLKIKDNTVDTLEATLSDTAEPAVLSGSTVNGFKVKTYAKGEAAPTVGSYSVSLELSGDPVAGAPAGSGYAIAKVDAKGVVKITGKTGDGTAFTASAANSADHQFIVFANPYKRDGCFLAGKITLTAREGGGFHMAVNVGVDFQWKKTSTDKDKSYRVSFGPLAIVASAEPWAPTKGANVSSYLDLGLGKSIPVAFGASIPNSRLPLELALDAKNNLVVFKGAVGSPTSKDWAKVFKGKIDIKTGKFSITIILEDKRKVTVEGVIKVPVSVGEEDFTLAPGFVLIPPVDKNGTIISEAVEFQGPPIVDETIADAAGKAGTYSATYEDLKSGTAKPPANVVKDKAVVKFTLSSDLRTVTFNGRKLLLLGNVDDSPAVYTDVEKNFYNNMTFNVYYNFEGKITHFAGLQTQIVRKGLSVETRTAYFQSKAGTVAKLP